MNSIGISILILSIIFLIPLSLFVYKKRIGLSVFMKGSRTPPDITIVLIVRNNEKMLQHCLDNITLAYKYITEIVIVDMGSVDNTIKVANSFDKRGINLKIYSVDITMEYNDAFNVIRNHVRNEEVLIIDLDRIGQTNPNVYTPDIFRAIDAGEIDKATKYDERINGIKLLKYDFQEREKNSYILKEYVIETLNNIYMQIEHLATKDNNSRIVLTKKLAILNEYLASTINKVGFLASLVGRANSYENNLNDSLTQLFQEYAQNTGVAIKYKVSQFKDTLDEYFRFLLLSVTQDLLNLVLQSNAIQEMEVICVSRSKEVKFLLKYNSKDNGSNVFNDKGTFNYLILQSIQNRLNFIGGNLRIKVDKDKVVTLFMRIPIVSAGRKDDKNENI